MFRTFYHLWYLAGVATVVAVPSARGDVFPGHQHHHQHRSVRSSVQVIAADSASYVAPCAAPCGTGLVDAIATSEMYSGIQFSASQYSTLPFSIPTAKSTLCPAPTNALLRIWVDDRATVWVNGQKTKPQRLAGVHRGSRIISLTRLTPDQIYETLVEAALGESTKPEDRQTQTVLTRAGQSYETRFAVEDPPAVEPKSVPPVVDEAVGRAQEAAQAAHRAATTAQEASRRAEERAAEVSTAAEAARAEIRKKLEEMARLYAGAQQAAKQAARTKDECFEFLENDESVVAWVSYKPDGSIAELHFDGPKTRSELCFKETTGGLAKVDGVEIPVNYYFTIQTPDTTVTGGFRDGTEFEILDQRAVFDKGKAKVAFFDRDEPTRHLSNQFKSEFFKYWSRHYHGGRIKVEIHAIRPNRKEAPVATIGNRMTILLQEIPN